MLWSDINVGSRERVDCGAVGCSRSHFCVGLKHICIRAASSRQADDFRQSIHATRHRPSATLPRASWRFYSVIWQFPPSGGGAAGADQCRAKFSAEARHFLFSCTITARAGGERPRRQFHPVCNLSGRIKAIRSSPHSSRIRRAQNRIHVVAARSVCRVGLSRRLPCDRKSARAGITRGDSAPGQQASAFVPHSRFHAPSSRRFRTARSFTHLRRVDGLPDTPRISVNDHESFEASSAPAKRLNRAWPRPPPIQAGASI